MELNIDGVGVVEVDDIFTSLPKNEQEDFINKIKSVYSEEQNDIDLNYGKSEEKKRNKYRYR
jgi:predicted HAD superfamily phosphohydrolase